MPPKTERTPAGPPFVVVRLSTRTIQVARLAEGQTGKAGDPPIYVPFAKLESETYAVDVAKTMGEHGPRRP